MEYNQEQIATDIANLLNSDRFLDVLIGKTGGAPSGGSLVVRSGDKQISAIAVGEVPPGDCVALKETSTGKWYAVSSYDEGKNDDHLIRYRRWRQPEDPQKYPVKTVFAIYTDNNIVFYLGGDRKSKEVYEILDYTNSNFVRNATSSKVVNLGGNKFFLHFRLINNSGGVYGVIKNNNDYRQFISNETYERNYLGNYLENIKHITSNGLRIIQLEDSEINVDYEILESREIKTPDNLELLEYETDYLMNTLRIDGSFSEVRLNQNFDLEFEEFKTAKILRFQEYRRDIKEHFYRQRLGSPVNEGSSDISEFTTFTEFDTTIIVNKVYNIAYWIFRDALTGWDLIYNYFLLHPGDPMPSGEIFFVRGNMYKTLNNINPSISNVPAQVNNKNEIAQAADPYKYGRSYYDSETEIAHYLIYPDVPHQQWVSWIENWYSSGSGSDPYLYGTRTYSQSVDLLWEDSDKLGYTLQIDGTDIYEGIVPELGEEFDRRSYEATLKGYAFDKKTIYVPMKKDLTNTVEGVVVAMNGSNGTIYQDYKASIIVKEGWEIGFSNENSGSDVNTYMFPNTRFFKQKFTTFERREEKNILKLEYGKEENKQEITLNTNDFGVINLDDWRVILSPQLTEVSTSLTINITNRSIKYVKNLNGSNFSPSSFNGNVLIGWEFNGKPALIRGTIATATYNIDTFSFVITLTINSIKLNTPTSFNGKLILDNGSFYNYFFRKDVPIKSLPYNVIGYRNGGTFNFKEVEGAWYPLGGFANRGDMFNLFLNKSVLPVIPLSPTFLSLWLSVGYMQWLGNNVWYLFGEGLVNQASLNLTTDNIVENKIYSVVKTEKNKAWIEQWDIKDNGDVKYNKVFQVDYVPLKKPKEENNERLKVFAHSYYPIK